MPIGAVGGVPAADYVPPVGIVLTLGVDTSPAELYPGTTWARIKDRFLWGASDAHPLGETGGSATHTLTVDEMPAHTHGGSTSSSGSHSHTAFGLTTTTYISDKWYAISGVYDNDPKFGNKTFTLASAGAHTHTVTVGSTGGGQAWSLMNPYEAVNFWQRVG